MRATTDLREQALANCRLLFGPSVDIVTLRPEGFYQAIAVKVDLRSGDWESVLHSESRQPSTITALGAFLKATEIQLAEQFSAGGVSVPFSQNGYQSGTIPRNCTNSSGSVVGGSSSTPGEEDSGFQLVATLIDSPKEEEHVVRAEPPCASPAAEPEQCFPASEDIVEAIPLECRPGAELPQEEVVVNDPIGEVLSMEAVVRWPSGFKKKKKQKSKSFGFLGEPSVEPTVVDAVIPTEAVDAPLCDIVENPAIAVANETPAESAGAELPRDEVVINDPIGEVLHEETTVIGFGGSNKKKKQKLKKPGFKKTKKQKLKSPGLLGGPSVEPTVNGVLPTDAVEATLCDIVVEPAIAEAEGIPTEAAEALPVGISEDPPCEAAEGPCITEVSEETKSRDRPASQKNHTVILKISYQNSGIGCITLQSMVNLPQNTKAAILEASAACVNSSIGKSFSNRRNFEIKSGVGKYGEIDVSTLEEGKWPEYLDYFTQFTVLPEFTVVVVDEPAW